jgi:transitional endoplasmic reticulum ATPase
MFKMHMSGRPAAENIDYDLLANKTENYVASDIAYIVNDAATRAFEDDVEITQELLEEVINENSPSVSQKDLRFYENIKEEMEAVNKSSERRRVGFT